jgi:hypothetical protein
MQGWLMVDFLMYGEPPNRNIDRMFNKLSLSEQEDWEIDYYEISKASPDELYYTFPLKTGTPLLLDENYVDKLILITESQNQMIVDTEDTPPFIVDALKELVESDLYVQRRGTAMIQSPVCTVWVWSRAMWNNNKAAGLINISPFIERLNVNSGGDGANFNMSLSPAGATFFRKLKGGGWRLEETDYIKQNGKLGYLSNSAINKNDTERADYFFNNVLQKNDMIFIQFEPLNIEQPEPHLAESYFVGENNLPNQFFDMIGFIDNVGYSMNPLNSMVTINVGGGDMTQLFNQDSFYFYPEQFLLEEQGGMYYNMEDEKGLKRTTNQLAGFTQEFYRKLGTIYSFILNALSTTGLVPGELFSFYGDSVSKYYYVGGLDQNNEAKWGFEPADGAYQIVKLVIDERIADRHIVDKNLGIESGSVFSFMQRTIVPPFVQILFDTYKSQYYITIRQAPWDKKGYKELAEMCEKNFTITNEDVITETLSFNTNEIYTWYRLIPKASFAGVTEETVWIFFKAVKFPEYTDVFGERILELTSNYLNFSDEVETEKKEQHQASTVMNQAVKDLKFMVDCYAYMPFTRTGTLTIRGDRRYRKGLIVYHEPTDEYFYVDSVAQSFRSDAMSTDRTTILNVSRGMKKSYIDMYFNIIETPFEEGSYNSKNKFKEKPPETKTPETKTPETKTPEGETPEVKPAEEEYSQEWIKNTISEWRVNSGNFKFFLMRKQMGPSINKEGTVEVGIPEFHYGQSVIDD